MSNRNRFKPGDKVVLRDLNEIKFNAWLIKSHTDKLDKLYSNTTYMSIEYADGNQVKLYTDDLKYYYMRFKLYNDYQLEEDLFLV